MTDVYSKMQDVLKTHGLTTQSSVNDNGNYCLLGARYKAMYDEEPNINSLQRNGFSIYSHYGTEELADICHERLLESPEIVDDGTEDVYDRVTASEASIWWYNDFVIRGNLDEALALLEEAKTRREQK